MFRECILDKERRFSGKTSLLLLLIQYSALEVVSQLTAVAIRNFFHRLVAAAHLVG